MRRLTSRAVLALALACLFACYASSAARRSERIVAKGFNFEDRGPWLLVTGPGSLVLAGANMLVGSVLPIGGGVDPREPEAKWFHSYDGAMRPGKQVAIVCNRERSTIVTGIREVPGGAWRDARHEKWHFPVCIEALPGSYELEVHYFVRDHLADSDESVTRQAESTAPSVVRWSAEAGAVYVLTAYLGDAQPSSAMPPQRHIPRSRALGTTWWELEEADWYARIERQGSWDALEGPVVEQRRAWVSYESRR